MMSQFLYWEFQNGPFIQYDDGGRISSIVISKITTRNRRVSSNNSTNHDGEIGYNSTIEIGSHNDTRYFGHNFLVMSSTEKLCSVTAFLNELATTNYVAIVTSATVIIDDNSAVFISVFWQGIDLTKKIDKIPINADDLVPNASTTLLILLVNLDFDANNVFFPFLIQGPNCLTDSFYPSDNELKQSTWVLMGDEKSWYPLNVAYPNILVMSQTIK